MQAGSENFRKIRKTGDVMRMSGSRTDAAILRINQTRYATDLPVQAAVSADSEVILKNEAGDVISIRLFWRLSPFTQMA